MAFGRISIDPAVMGGAPCIRNLRVTVSLVLAQLASGRTIDEILDDYPYLEREDIYAALEFGSALADSLEIPVALTA